MDNALLIILSIIGILVLYWIFAGERLAKKQNAQYEVSMLQKRLEVERAKIKPKKKKKVKK